METAAHLRLKTLALHALVGNGCGAAGLEVRCPLSRHRVDAAGWLDPLSRRVLAAGSELPESVGIFSRGRLGKTVIIECKQSRADFLTDSRDADELLVERERLRRVRGVLEEQIVKVCEPHLRRSGSRLFADMEDWDFSASRVGSYQAVLRDLRRLDQRLHGESKFWLLAHYRLADYLYLAAPRGVVRASELPEGWGLLEIDSACLDDGHEHACEPDGCRLRVRVQAPERAGKPEHRSRLLRNIAAATTLAAVREAARRDRAARAFVPGAPDRRYTGHEQFDAGGAALA
jgi:hypothetical protein